MNNDLVTRIEQARGPDRELDEALGLEGGVASYYGDGAYAGPEYTASIDAAMTLVPEPNKLVSIHFDYDENERLWFVEVDGFDVASAATRELALCAAALRARASQEGQPHDQ